jgi:hypothetical protein
MKLRSVRFHEVHGVHLDDFGTVRVLNSSQAGLEVSLLGVMVSVAGRDTALVPMHKVESMTLAHVVAGQGAQSGEGEESGEPKRGPGRPPKNASQ